VIWSTLPPFVSNAFEFTKLSEIKDLRSSTYGNSLIETISLSLQTNGGNVDQITNLLTDLFSKLVQDQTAADNEWSVERQRLDDAIEELKAKIEELKKSIAADKASLKHHRELVAQAVENLKQFREQVAANNAALKQNEENRQADSASYQQSVQEHQDVINAIELVVNELNKIVGSVAGERPDHVEVSAEEQRDRAFANSFVQLSPLKVDVEQFLQLATTADQEALQKLIGMLNALSNTAKQSLEEDTEHEEKSRETYEALKASLTEDNENLNQQIQEQEENKAAYEAEISRLVTKIAAEEELLAETQQTLASTIQERQDKEAQYEADKAERTEEKSVIQRLQKIVKERLANMSKFLSANADQ